MKLFFRRFSVLLIGLGSWVFSYAATQPVCFPGVIAPFSAKYAIYYGIRKVGMTSEHFSYDKAGKYLFLVDTYLTELAFQHFIEGSEGSSSRCGFQPTNYALFSSETPTESIPSITRGIQDNLSQELMLRYYLLTHQSLQALHIATPCGFTVYDYQIINPHENISTLLGSFYPTIHIRFMGQHQHQIDEWLAQKYDYLPMRIQTSQKGVVLSTVYVTEITLREKEKSDNEITDSKHYQLRPQSLY